jgi:hypothetical protein
MAETQAWQMIWSLTLGMTQVLSCPVRFGTEISKGFSG